jgi:hypothetical protein
LFWTNEKMILNLLGWKKLGIKTKENRQREKSLISFNAFFFVSMQTVSISYESYISALLQIIKSSLTKQFTYIPHIWCRKLFAINFGEYTQLDTIMDDESGCYKFTFWLKVSDPTEKKQTIKGSSIIRCRNL